MGALKNTNAQNTCTAYISPIQASKGNQPPSLKDGPGMLLHLVKPHERTRLALQVIEQSCQRNKLLGAPTPPIRAMVHFFLVSRRIEMHVQSVEAVEFAVADVALPGVAVVRQMVRFVRGAFFIVPPDLLVGDDTVRVACPD